MSVVFADPGEGAAKKNETIGIEINWINSVKETSANTRSLEPADNALPVRISLIPSTYKDCNENPKEYDIYDGKLIFDTAPCGTGCYAEQITLFGSSMVPTIKNNEGIYIKHDPQYNQQPNFSIGSIIAYDSLGQIAGEYSKNTVHRIVGINEGDAEIVYFEGTHEFLTHVPNEVNELTITRFGKNYTLKRPFYVVKGDNNSVCEVVASNMIHGVLSGVMD